MNFISKKARSSILLSSISTNIKESAKFFTENQIETARDVRNLTERMKEFENKGDTYIHELILELNKVFITPIDREDILQLALSMDDVLDMLELCSAQFEMYEITRSNDFIKRLSTAIYACTCEIDISINLIHTMHLIDIRTNTIKIKDYESTCNMILRHAIKHLFSNEKNPIVLIKYKEMYDTWKKLAESCQHVANVLETIIMKNA